jgi:hypothetical protein
MSEGKQVEWDEQFNRLRDQVGAIAGLKPRMNGQAVREFVPSAAQLRQDVIVEKNTRLHLKDPQPGRYYAAVRISARELQHPEFYVKLLASKQLKDSCLLDGPVGDPLARATAVYGKTVEHTQATPGLQPATPLCRLALYPGSRPELTSWKLW